MKYILIEILYKASQSCTDSWGGQSWDEFTLRYQSWHCNDCKNTLFLQGVSLNHANNANLPQDEKWFEHDTINWINDYS